MEVVTEKGKMTICATNPTRPDRENEEGTRSLHFALVLCRSIWRILLEADVPPIVPPNAMAKVPEGGLMRTREWWETCMGMPLSTSCRHATLNGSNVQVSEL